jgi:hypothetical protein|tara:strand:- start:407 stop:1090 length:684 start_codon:yes stop_codon:yes gene_type:complete
MIYKIASRIIKFSNKPKFYDLISLREIFIKKFLAQRGTYLEFGVYKGNSALTFYKALSSYHGGQPPIGHYPMYLFDSFIGLPSSNDQKDQFPNWKEGVFDVGGGNKFKKMIIEKGLPADRFEIIEGFYEQSLKDFTIPDGALAGIVNMDCDYYSSTKEALDFLKPYLQNGTLFYFDDLHSFLGNPSKGQLAAINEFNRENSNIGINPCPHFQGKYEGRIYWSCLQDE